MNRIKYKIFISSLLVIIIMLILILRQYNKPHDDTRNLKSEVILEAGKLLDDFKQDENFANNKYNDKVIQIQGEISKITTTDGNSVIILKDSLSVSSIICNMQPEENSTILHLKKGQNISIKGIYTGYLLDVIMNRCVIVNNFK